MPFSLAEFNRLPPAAFAAALEGVYAGGGWIPERLAGQQPFQSLAHLKQALVRVVEAAGAERQLSLIAAYEDPFGGGGGSGQQAGQHVFANASDRMRWESLNRSYADQFGFPCVLAADPRQPAGDLIQALERRLGRPRAVEFDECLRQTHRIAEQRLNTRFGFVPALGQQVLDWAERLAIHSEPGYRERGELTVTYLTDAHRACARQLREWMQACGFDEVWSDAIGNVVGLYHGTDRTAPRLLTGSHYDTVRNGGRYDGRLGIFVPMLCVRELARSGQRLRFGLEVVAFAEEEGQRYKAAFLGSAALAGRFDSAWLDQVDADGIRMREAMALAGLRAEEIPALARNPAQYLGFVEVHIEQGPVLAARNLPLGVVSSINGSVRCLCELRGQAAHAGTTPMGNRRDAGAAAAEMLLYLERRAGAQPDLVGTVGQIEVPGGSVNVIPGLCRFSLDIRATTDTARDACVEDVLAQFRQIAERRGVRFSAEVILKVSAAPSAPAWQARWAQAVAALGLPVLCLPSGAGHDAMKLHEILPQAMLFVRGLNDGISHNPLEGVTDDDADLAVRAFEQLLGQMHCAPA